MGSKRSKNKEYKQNVHYTNSYTRRELSTRVHGREHAVGTNKTNSYILSKLDKKLDFFGKGGGEIFDPPPPQLCNAIQYTIQRPVLFVQYTQFPGRANEWQSSRWMTPKQMGRMNRMLQGMNELRFRKDEGSKCKKENNEMIDRTQRETYTQPRRIFYLM